MNTTHEDVDSNPDGTPYRGVPGDPLGNDGAKNSAVRPAMKYRKKPIVVEAFQMTEERRGDNIDWPNWLNMAWQCDPQEPGGVGCSDFPNSDGTDKLLVGTLNGPVLLEWDEWIVKGVEGELYPCDPEIFTKTYEPVNE